jgi:hypothetical protein
VRRVENEVAALPALTARNPVTADSFGHLSATTPAAFPTETTKPRDLRGFVRWSVPGSNRRPPACKFSAVLVSVRLRCPG